jgi:phosphoribosylformylglycinamidine synthase
MIIFFGNSEAQVYAVQVKQELSNENTNQLIWLFGGDEQISSDGIKGDFIGPRAAMVTPWSTNAVEITQNMGIEGVVRIEQYQSATKVESFDPMLQQRFSALNQELFSIDVQPAAVEFIEDISAYNQKEGLALNEEEVAYLEGLSEKLGRKLTDSEVFGFSQVNSEHCRHKIFNGVFIIDGEEKELSLFKLIRKTSETHPNDIVSAYKDNVAFIKGPKIEQFAPASADKPDYYGKKIIQSVISIKAETHNFPTTVEPFNGAATGSGGEIRDRIAGGKGSLPLAGTAVYMTPYSRLKEGRKWEEGMPARDWLYQTPMDILIKASNGASDFGNKFGQPLISGSVLTFEHEENNRKLGFDKVIMLAGGIGFGIEEESLKDTPKKDDRIVVMGGENYRIGMGGAAVSSADTGEFSSAIELNAIQRSNPEMQKRVMNAIRGMIEEGNNPIVSIHDHGAGGHLNCLSELVEDTGGAIDVDKLPVGDPTLSCKEIIGNESQERMGLVIGKEDLEKLKRISDRERAPIYDVGVVTGDDQFSFESKLRNESPIKLALADMFGNSPKTIMNDTKQSVSYKNIEAQSVNIESQIKAVLQLESVACKDWLTNKVDRCVTGKVAKQQTTGELQLPLNNCGVMALDYAGKSGIATSIGHSPLTALIDPKAGSKNAIAESLLNIVWAPLEQNLKSVSLSANWMWPCKNPGEDARLYEAVEAASEFAINLGINIPTGKDSLSMKQKYKDDEVIAPGTVIISAGGHCNDIRNVIEPTLQKEGGALYYIDFSKDELKLGGSAFGQTLNKLGTEAPSILDDEYFGKAFNALQEAIKDGMLVAGHDISSGGLVTALLEMCFPTVDMGAKINLSGISAKDFATLLFAENSSVLVQVSAGQESTFEQFLSKKGVEAVQIGAPVMNGTLQIDSTAEQVVLNVAEYRDIWFETSYLLDEKQSGKVKAKERYENYKKQPLQYKFGHQFPVHFNLPKPSDNAPIAAVIREKGSNSEREMANALYLAGFRVRDVHMTDLISGRETLEDVKMIAAVGGFSNSDVLGSAKGWAGAFLYNPKAKKALEDFFARKDTLSLGVCNGCQLFVELGLINPDHDEKPKMLHNDSHKFECTFTSVKIQENNSVMLGNLSGSTLGIWSAHGEGKFHLPKEESAYQIVGKYGYEGYPSNPNGSDYNTAIMCSEDGRHLVMMPHLERSIFPWNWAYYPESKDDAYTPWLKAFINAKEWCENPNLDIKMSDSNTVSM